MREFNIDRRQLLGGLGAGLALTSLPVRALAVFDGETAWPSVASFVPRFVAEQPIPGALITVGRGQVAPQYFADGVAAIGSDRLVGPDTLWRLYSMTKPITGMATMMLVEDGTIGLDQDIAEILPAFANMRVLTSPESSLESRPAAGPITVRHLLTHTAGLGYSIISTGPLLREYQQLGLLPFAVGSVQIPGEIPAPGAENSPSSLEEFANRLASVPLIADPGSKWSYSVAQDLLGRVIEVASGVEFGAFLEQRLFAPLGMADTYFQVPQSKIPQMTSNYGFFEGELTLIDPANDSIFARPPPFPFGGAGLVGSARDYDRFLMMLLGEGAVGDTRIMSRETAQLAMSDLLPPGIDKSAMYEPTGFGAAGRVNDSPGAPAGNQGSFGWGGAAGTVAWVDRVNNLRAAGYVQHYPSNATPFRAGLFRSVYADLRQ